MKKLLIISPSFPPVNAADMHRVRQSVSYLEELGWKPTVVVVEPARTEGVMDPLLSQTLPSDLEVIAVNAFSTRWTRKFGLGSLALRSLWYYFRVVTALLRRRRFDLVYFSTTMFPVTILGAYWRHRFGIPYIIDMQDPWHSEHDLQLPPSQRPSKFWFSYRLNKYLEPVAMKKAAGIIAVSQGYCTMLQQRYPNITPANCTVIPFGAYARDFEMLSVYQANTHAVKVAEDCIPVVYVGRGGHDMHKAATLLFKAFKLGLSREPAVFGKVRMYFVGTSYAAGGKGKQTLKPVADREAVGAYVTEHTDRVPYVEALHLLSSAGMLLIPGSVDPNYTASKLYPYIMANKPLLAVFNQQSSVVNVLQETRAGECVVFADEDDTAALIEQVYRKWLHILSKLPYKPDTDWAAFEKYTAREMTRRQADFFDGIYHLNPNRLRVTINLKLN
jgi:hypothetical protein